MPRLVALYVLVGSSLLTAGTCRADSSMLLDAAGRVIGYSTGASCIPGNDPAPMYVFSHTGYYACIAPQQALYTDVIPVGEPSNLTVFAFGYESADCTGQGMAFIYNTGALSPPYAGGFVARLGGGDLFYADKGTSQPVIFGSYGNSTTACTGSPAGPGPFQALPAFRNDIAVTGFSSVPYKAPLHFEVLPETYVSDLIFFDTFD